MLKSEDEAVNYRGRTVKAPDGTLVTLGRDSSGLWNTTSREMQCISGVQPVNGAQTKEVEYNGEEDQILNDFYKDTIDRTEERIDLLEKSGYDVSRLRSKIGVMRNELSSQSPNSTKTQKQAETEDRADKNPWYSSDKIKK